MSSKKKADKDSKVNILVVDDESGIREMFTEILSDLGYRVLTAKNADEAQKIVVSESVMMAFLDIWMPPGINGIDLLKIWKEKNLLTFPVVVVSAYTDVKTTVDAMKNGAINVMDKPVEPKKIEEIVRKCEAETKAEIFDGSIKELNMGESKAILKLKGLLLRHANSKGALCFVGKAKDGGEHFGLLLHPTGKPRLVINDPKQLETNPNSLLAEVKNGSIYVRNLVKLNSAQQQGLLLIIRNMNQHSVRVIVESETSIDELKKEGKLNEKLIQALKPNQIEIPDLIDYEKDLPVLVKLILERLNATDCLNIKEFESDGIRSLLGDLDRWRNAGLDALIGIIKLLLRSTNNGVISIEHVSKLFNPQGVDAGTVTEDIFAGDLREARICFERLYFSKLLERVNNNVQEAAKLSGLERTYLYRKVKTLLGQDILKSIQ